MRLQPSKKNSVKMPNLKKGDEVVFQLNNCVLIISIEDNTMKQKFIGGQPIKLDHTLKIYESEE